MSDEVFDEIDPVLEATLTLPDEQLLALELLIEKLGGVEEARDTLELIRQVRAAA